MKKLIQACALVTLLPASLSASAFNEDDLDQVVSFRCQSSHRYLNLHGNGTIGLADNTDVITNPGTRWIIRRIGDSYAIQSYNGNYLEAINAGVQAVANQNNTSWATHPTTHWRAVHLPGGNGHSYAIRNHRTHHYLEGHYAGGGAINYVHASQNDTSWANHPGTHFQIVRH